LVKASLEKNRLLGKGFSSSQPVHLSKSARVAGTHRLSTPKAKAPTLPMSSITPNYNIWL